MGKTQSKYHTESAIEAPDLLALIESGEDLRIRIHGELNLDNHSGLRSLLEEVLTKTKQSLILLDLSGVHAISSSAFGALDFGD